METSEQSKDVKTYEVSVLVTVHVTDESSAGARIIARDYLLKQLEACKPELTVTVLNTKEIK